MGRGGVTESVVLGEGTLCETSNSGDGIGEGTLIGNRFQTDDIPVFSVGEQKSILFEVHGMCGVSGTPKPGTIRRVLNRRNGPGKTTR